MRNAAGATEAALEQGRDPDELEAEAERVRAQEQEIGTEVEAHRGALEEAVTARRAAEDAAAEAERRVAGLQRAAADRREGLARLHGQVNALKSRAAAADDEIGRLGRAREDVIARAERAQRDFTALETRVAGLDAGEEGLDAEHEAAVAALDDIEERLAKAREEAQQADRDRSTLAARKDALEMGLNRKDGAGALLAASDQVSGLLGSVAALLTVRSGYEAAVASALGSAADAVAVTDADAAVAAIGRLKDDDLGRAGLLLGAGPAADRRLAARCPQARRTPSTSWSAPTRCAPRWAGCCSRPRSSTTCAPPASLVAALPDVTAVTRDGDVLGAHFAAGGSSAPAEPDRDPGRGRRGRRQRWPRPSRPRSGWASTCPASRASGWRRRSASTSPWPSCTSPTPPWRPSPRSSASSAPRRARPAARPSGWCGRSSRPRRRATRTSPAWPSSSDGSPRPRRRPRRSPTPARASGSPRLPRAARQAEMEARLALRTSEERARALHGRVDQLVRAAAGRARGPGPRRRAPRAADPRGPGRRGGRHRGRPGAAAARGVDPPRHRAAGRPSSRRAAAASRSCSPCAAGCASSAASTTSWSTPSTATRWPAPSSGCASSSSRSGRSRSSGSTPPAWSPTTDPTQLVPFTGEVPEGEETPEPTPFVREEQQKRLRTAERALAQLGRINPLALEEFSAMEERHKFLTEQLEDLKATRKDLLDIVREVDQRVEEVFTEAYADVSKAFDETFARLFPGGEGRLVLTEPGDMLDDRRRGRGPARRARRSSGCRCCPAASGRWSRSRSWSRCSRPGPRRSTSSTRSRRRSTTPTSAGCWRSTRSCGPSPSCS